MKKEYSLIFNLFRFYHNLLRGSGLGKYKIFRDIRDLTFKITSPKNLLTIEVFDMRMCVEPNSSALVQELLINGVFEKTETKLIHSLLKPGHVFVDVGGNIGYYTLIASKLVGENGRVISFEPEPINYSYLFNNVKLNKLNNITLVQSALSNKIEKHDLYLDKNNTAAHHLYDIGNGAQSISVDVTTLDQYLESQDFKIDVIKMDIEGYEPYALNGMRNTIFKNPSIIVLTEYFPEMIKKAGSDPTDYINSLRSMGFELAVIDDNNGLIENVSDEFIKEYSRKYFPVNLYCHK